MRASRGQTLGHRALLPLEQPKPTRGGLRKDRLLCSAFHARLRGPTNVRRSVGTGGRGGTVVFPYENVFPFFLRFAFGLCFISGHSFLSVPWAKDDGSGPMNDMPKISRKPEAALAAAPNLGSPRCYYCCCWGRHRPRYCWGCCHECLPLCLSVHPLAVAAGSYKLTAIDWMSLIRLSDRGHNWTYVDLPGKLSDVHCWFAYCGSTYLLGFCFAIAFVAWWR